MTEYRDPEIVDEPPLPDDIPESPKTDEVPAE